MTEPSPSQHAVTSQCVYVCVSRWLEFVGSVGTVQQPVRRWNPDPQPDLSGASGGVVPV